MVSYRGRVAPNRIDLPGTAEEAWDGWVELKRLPVADPMGWPSAVIVAAHPDDEILGAGGTLARLAAGGARLRLVAVTDGEASHPGTDPRDTARRRTAESADALRLLGVRDIEVIRLCFPDTGLTACEDELSGRLGELCDGFGVCLAPWEQDAHADHEAAGRAARRAVRQPGQQVLSYPIWMWHWARPGDTRVPWARLLAFDIPEELLALKQQALRSHQSQLRDREGQGPVLVASIVERAARRHEYFFA